MCGQMSHKRSYDSAEVIKSDCTLIIISCKINVLNQNWEPAYYLKVSHFFVSEATQEAPITLLTTVNNNLIIKIPAQLFSNEIT